MFSLTIGPTLPCYLGSTITEDGRCSKEILKRIAIAKELSIKEENYSEESSRKDSRKEW